MRTLLIVLCVLLAPAARAQTIRQLEDSLRNELVKDTAATRLAYILLAKDPYNDPAVNAITQGFRAYGREKRAVADDSLAAFFQRLIAHDPRNPMAYVLQARHGGRAFYRKSDSLWLAAMQQALAVDSNHVAANLALGEESYSRFLQGRAAQLFGYREEDEDYVLKLRDTARRAALLRKIEVKRQETEAALKRDAYTFAPLARRFLMRVWYQDAAQRPALQNALRQVAIFLQDPALLAELAEYHEVIAVDSAGLPADSPQIYFSLQTLMDTIGGVLHRGPWLANYLRVAESARYKQQWYSGPLAGYQEPLLDGVARPDTAYRFTWIGSFHYPAVFRLEERDGQGVLYWKAVVGKKRWFRKKLRGVLAIDHRRLSASELQGFHRLLDSAQFYQMPTSREVMGLDGARWILEANERGRYHMAHRWGGGELEPVCRYLIHLAPEAVRKNEFY